MILFQNTGFPTGILIDQILTDFIICLKKQQQQQKGKKKNNKKKCEESIFSLSNWQLF